MKQSIKDRIKFFSIIIGIVASIVTVYEVLFVNRKDGDININGDNGVVIQGNNNTIDQTIENLSVDEIIRKAQISFEKYDYKDVVSLYSKDVVKNEEIVLNNLGYIYSKGLGLDKDINKAYNYFNKNVQLNYSKDVLKNYVIFLLNSQNKEFIKEGIWILKHGVLIDDIKLNNFYYTMTEYSINDTYIISDQEYYQFIDNYYVEKNMYVLLNASSRIENNFFENYHLVDEYYQNGESTNLIRRYIETIKEFPYELVFFKI